MIGMGQVMGIALKLIANREKIAQAWGQIAPVIRSVREMYPQIQDLIDDIVPGTTVPEKKETMSVAWLQESLNQLDDADLVVDGDYGEKTREAVRKFQGDRPPLEADGWAGAATQAVIYDELAKLK